MPTITRIKKPASVQGCSWIDQYQYTNETINLPKPKWIGPTKRMIDVPLDHILTQQSGIQREYPDVAWVIPFKDYWSNLRSYPIDWVMHPWGGTIQAGQTVDVTIGTKPGVAPDKIIGLALFYTGDIKTGSGDYIPRPGGVPVGLNLNIFIPGTNQVTFRMQNNSGQAMVFSGGNLETRIMKTIQESINEVSMEMQQGHVAMSQICEDGLQYDKTEQVFAGLWAKEQQRQPGITMDDWNLFNDYYSVINAASNEVAIDSEFGLTALRAMLNNQADARKIPIIQPGGGSLLQTSHYFSLGYNNNRHRQVNGYLGGMYGLKNGIRPYDLIFNIEKQYAAQADRQVLVYCTIIGEGIDNQTERRGTFVRLPIPSPKGFIIRLQPPCFGFHLFENEAFITLFMAEKFVVWDDPGKLSQDINDFGPGFYGGFEPEKTKWEAEGQGAVTWNPNNPNHPPGPGNKEGHLSATVRVGDNGIFSGSKIYDELKTYCNQTRRYARHNFSVNGGAAQPGYKTTDIPTNGERGTSELHSYKQTNYGQNNILTLWEHKLPIVLEGKGDSGFMIYVLNVYADPRHNTTYNITLSNGTPIQIVHKGCRPGWYKIQL